MKKPSTPFPTSGYYGANYFCDREAETQTLLENFENGLSTTLIAIRRMGKTGLIHHFMQQASKSKKTTVYLDILATEKLQDLLDVLATGVIRAISEQTKPGKKVWDFIKSLRPVFSFDQFTGTPQVSFNVAPNIAEQNIMEILQLLEQHSQPVIIAIDEFQQILNYPEKNTDALLRSIIQQLKNVTFIFSGSRQHLMTGLFTHPSRPFYRSTQLMKLKKIPSPAYRGFILKHFRNYKRQIDEQVINEMLEWTRRHTYYVQLLCSKVFISKQKKITTTCWQQEAFKLLEEQKPVFFEYRGLLTKAQWQLLKAVAAEGTVLAPTSKNFLQKYELGTSATVLRSLEALLNKEMVYYDYTQEGEKYYRVYDLLFERWIQRNT